LSFPDLRGANTDGKDKQEATEEAIDCLGSYIAEAIATKRPIPPPSALKKGASAAPTTAYTLPDS
jgi:predicted RNase H-like HicB family nuclease